MGFWKDVKSVTSSTMGVLSEGASALAEGAEVMHYSAIKLSLELQIINRCRSLDLAYSQVDSSVDLKEEYRELELVINRLIKHSPEEKSELERKKEYYSELLRGASLAEARKRANDNRLTIESTIYDAPYAEQTDLKDYLIKLRLVRSLYKSSVDKEKVQDEIVRVENRVNELEDKRYSQDRILYSSGENKYLVNLKDGRLLGRVIFWHKSGQVKYEMNFSDGGYIASMNAYDCQGNHVLEYVGELFDSSLQVNLSSGAKIFEIDNSLSGEVAQKKLTFWFWDGYKVVSVCRHSRRKNFSIVPIVLVYAFLNFRFWCKFIYAWFKDRDATVNRLRELNESVDSLRSFHDQLALLKEKYNY